MRRGDREVTDLATIHAIVRACLVCRVGLAVDGEPYVVPVSFGLHYSGRDWDLEPARLAPTRVWRVDLDELTAKRSQAKG
jgi:nitroimidazol reductase NimA-like FMN-containing flavoprotein (pyridoxamine 5'-phosphate oxidase superfamily)